MGYYEDIYSKRLNRYGTTLQSRIQGQREREFEEYLNQSIYRTEFVYNDTDCVGVLEPNKQDTTQTVCYLLTKNSLNLPAGAQFTTDSNTIHWMVWWLERNQASGYHRYVVLRMNYWVAWTYNKTQYDSWVYLIGPGQSAITDAVQASTGATRYLENNASYRLIMPMNDDLHKEDYFSIEVSDTDVNFRVTEMDIVSTEGVEYVTLDPTPMRNNANIDQTVNDAANSWYIGGTN